MADEIYVCSQPVWVANADGSPLNIAGGVVLAGSPLLAAYRSAFAPLVLAVKHPELDQAEVKIRVVGGRHQPEGGAVYAQARLLRLRTEAPVEAPFVV
jgi:hypothetical protein